MPLQTGAQSVWFAFVIADVGNNRSDFKKHQTCSRIKDSECAIAIIAL